MQDILEGLNENQREAVISVDGPSLIIAGAGSGKTKVLTHKVAYILEEKKVAPWNIIAITFTNKAANEMKERIKNIVGDVSKDIWIGTFHSVCVRILRRWIQSIGFNSDFIIFDTSDQRSLVKAIMKELDINDKLFTDRGIISEISNAKNEMLEPKEYRLKTNGEHRKEVVADIYDIYQQRLQKNNAVDFDDIINYVIKILMQEPECLEYYTEKFKYILVDEYQDTNKAQFTLVTMLASKYGNITVVGDNDQGIYSFRGADISNILNFEKDFPGAKLIKLEQNYRCTQNILNAANVVIKKNETKFEKKLWTENEEGALPEVHLADNEYMEATFIVEQINKLKREEYYKNLDFAILYRMNTQSRAIEDILRRENVPYKIIGGLKFYERKEIKDLVGYLRLIHNINDDLSLKRVLNEPKRGIGKTSIDNIERLANDNNISMYEVVKNADKYELNRVFINSRSFVEAIEELRSLKDTLVISELVKQTLEKTGYKDALLKEESIEAENRIENLEEFLTVAIEFEEEFVENTLSDFLEGITLSSDIDSLDNDEDYVTLMTLHSAKGLEFPVVFMVGVEEGIFPGYKSIAEPKELEEERRLCYVGITRAKNNLFITCAKQRTIFGSTTCNNMSRFITEIPKEYLSGMDEIDKKQNLSTEYNSEWTYKEGMTTKKDNLATKAVNAFRTVDNFLSSIKTDKKEVDLNEYKVGVNIYHKKFGEGIINKVEQEGSDLKLDISFEKSGNKRLMAKYANLEIMT